MNFKERRLAWITGCQDGYFDFEKISEKKNWEGSRYNISSHLDEIAMPTELVYISYYLITPINVSYNLFFKSI